MSQPNGPRKAIRRAIRARLVNVTEAGTRVFTDRSEAIGHLRNGGELPALCLHSIVETPRPSMSAPKEYRREFKIGVEVIVPREPARSSHARAGHPLRATEAELVDRIADQVEAALLADPTLGGLVRDLEYSTTRFDFSAEGETPMGSALIEFVAVYYTRHLERAATDGAAPFLLVDVLYAPIDPAGNAAAEDLVELDQ